MSGTETPKGKSGTETPEETHSPLPVREDASLAQQMLPVVSKLSELVESSSRKKPKKNKFAARFTDTIPSSASEASDSELEDGNSKKDKAKAKTSKGARNLQDVLKTNKKILSKLAEKVNEGKETVDAEMNALLNSLDVKIENPYKESTRPMYSNMKHLKTRLDGGEASAQDYSYALNQFKMATPKISDEGFGVASVLEAAASVAEQYNLNTEQYYMMLRSRISQNSDLFKEITHHLQLKTPPAKFAQEILTTYGVTSTYQEVTKRLEEFTPSPTDMPQAVLRKLKVLAQEAGQFVPEKNRKDLVYESLKLKLVNLYPNTAPTLLQYENKPGNRNMQSLCRNFLALTPPIPGRRRMHRQQVLEIEEVPETYGSYTVNEVQDKPPAKNPSLKLTTQQLKSLRGKCYKCGNQSAQPPHMGRDCILYKDTPLASFVCKKCHKGVHLPAKCKQSEVSDDEGKVLHISTEDWDNMIESGTLESDLFNWTKNE